MKKTLADLSEECIFNLCIRSGQSYFGSHLSANIGSSERHFYMDLLIKYLCLSEPTRPIRVLELGSWVGRSSVTWASAVKKYGSLNSQVICVDAWAPIFFPSKLPEPWAQELFAGIRQALEDDKAFHLFLHNIKSSGHSDIVSYLRMPTEQALRLFAHESFDLVYIDADHSYAAVNRDIEMSKHLVKQGGLIAGDDLELQCKDVDLKNARAAADMDYIVDPKTQKSFHPGVTLAVYDQLGVVSSWAGCWAMRKISNENWSQIVLPEFSHIEKIPHLDRSRHDIIETGRLYAEKVGDQQLKNFLADLVSY